MVNHSSQGPVPTHFLQQSYMGGPPMFTMQTQPTYGPTGIPMPC